MTKDKVLGYINARIKILESDELINQAVINELIKVRAIIEFEENEVNETSRRFIALTRNDLIKSKIGLPIKDIEIEDFKSNSITMEEIKKAEVITFSDGNKIKQLKSRY